MGGKSGGSARTPIEEKNTLHSKQIITFLDIISEGEIEGFANGNDKPLKSIFLDDTPVQNPNNTFNKKGLSVSVSRGTKDQSYLPKFSNTQKVVSVQAEVKKPTPITRTVTDPLVTRVRVVIQVPALMKMKDNGDRVKTEVEARVELLKDGIVFNKKPFYINDKGNAPFNQDVLFDNLPDSPFDIRVTRITADAVDDKIQNATNWPVFVEIIDAKMTYPNTAVVGIEADSAQFGGNIPKRNYLIKGIKVQVPTTYNPETRTYAGGIWDGSFKHAWTNNPAWIYYDLITNDRYGLGEKLGQFQVDRFALYSISKFCDELVDDGHGGKEPRVTFNAYITDQREAYQIINDLASSFFGLSVWDGRMFRTTLDAPSDVTAIYSNTNVVDGMFNYESVSRKAIFTAVDIQYIDAKDGYRTKLEHVEDGQLIRRYGLNVNKVVAFGCTSRGQAVRYGKWILETSKLERESVTFSVGAEGLRHLPHDIIQVADSDHAGASISGRIVAIAGDVVTLDRPVEKVIGAKFSYIDANQDIVVMSVKAQPKPEQLRLDKPIAGADVGDVYSVSRTDVKPRLFRAISIAENGDGTYGINAIEHIPEKMKIITEGISFEKDKNTIWELIPEIINGTVGSDGDDIILTWDNLSTPSGVLTYEIKLYKDGKLYREWHGLTEPFFRFEGLPKGNYVVEIRAKNARGQYSNALTKVFNLNYTVTNLIATPKLFAIGLTWKLPEILNDNVWSEVWYGKTDKIDDARLLVSLPKPLNNFVLDNLSLDHGYYFWVRLSNQNGITGEFTQSVFGEPEQDATKLLEMLEGKITETELGKDLVANLTEDITGNALEKVKEDIDLILEESETIGEITTAVGDAEANLKLLALSSITGDKVQSGQTLLVNAKSELNRADLLLQHLSQVTNDRSRSIQYLALHAEMGNVQANFTRLEEVVVTETEAMAQSIEELKAQIGDDLIASITEMRQVIADLDGNVKAMVTIKAETMSNGKKVVAGLSFGVDGEESQFIVMANKFAITTQDGGVTKTPFMVITENGVTTVAVDGSIIADGTILGQHIRANQTIKAPVISGGRIDAGRFLGGSIDIGNGQFTVNNAGKLYAQNADIVGKITATSGVFKGRIEATDGFFNGTVQADKIDGDLQLAHLVSVTNGEITLKLDASSRVRKVALSAFTLELGGSTMDARGQWQFRVIANGSVVATSFTITKTGGTGSEDPPITDTLLGWLPRNVPVTIVISQYWRPNSNATWRHQAAYDAKNPQLLWTI